MKIPEHYYRNPDTVAMARDLLGKVLCTNIGGSYTAGVITEAEAYCGGQDKACHAYNYRRTARTETMFAPGGVAYVYLCYGIHHLFNVVTNVADEPHAVLIRGVQALEGIDHMLARRKQPKLSKRLSAGPGTLSQALGIHTSQTGTSLQSDIIWLEDRGIEIGDNQVTVGPRIGVDYAGEDAKLPYRFLTSLPFETAR